MIYSVQYMRAIAALFVVIHHAAWKGGQYSSSSFDWFVIGEAGVDLFFIISGYIMCHTVDNKNINFTRFIKARVLRIIPLYWVLTTMALAVYLLFPEKVNSSGGHTNIFLSYTLFPTLDSYLINNGWTLSYEFFFYFLFAFSLGFAAKYKYLYSVAIILALVSIGNIVSSNIHLFDFITNPLLLEFTFGIGIFYLFKERTLSFSTGAVLIALSILLIVLVNNFQPDLSRVISYGIPSLLFFIGMIALEPIFKRNNKNIFNQLFEYIGNSSYSLYLSHPFALVACSIIFEKLGLHQYGFLFVALLVVCSVVSGHLCYLILEKNLTKLTKKMKKVSPLKKTVA